MRLHRVNPRGARQQPRRDRARQRLHARAGERAATDLHDEVVELRRTTRQHLVDQGLATVDRESVLVALAAERQRAGAQRFVKAVNAGIARFARCARARHDRRAERVQAIEHRRFGIRRDEDLQRTRSGAREHGRGERRVAATGDRQRRLVPALRHREVEQDAHQVARLVRAADVPGLVLHPHARCRAARRAPAAG